MLARCYVAKSAVCRGLFSCPLVFCNMRNWRAACRPVVLKLFQDEAHLCKVNYFVAPQKKIHDENILLQ